MFFECAPLRAQDAVLYGDPLPDALDLKARGVWDAKGLIGLKTPTFFVAGSQDDISGYEKGIKAIYEGAVHADRYLVTYKNARHNVAPNPPPVEALQPGLHIDEYYRYAKPLWDQRKIINSNPHFVTAFLDMHLKSAEYSTYLDVPQDSNEKIWEGFKNPSSTGMVFLCTEGMASCFGLPACFIPYVTWI
ncbi:MAG: hypothetical protein WBM98_17120 [Maribacter sp.]|uniref:hypothetical protein n=1 Tax=Maribacter sp. TaxID=1897614 RepID=UPI003C717D32